MEGIFYNGGISNWSFQWKKCSEQFAKCLQRYEFKVLLSALWSIIVRPRKDNASFQLIRKMKTVTLSFSRFSTVTRFTTLANCYMFSCPYQLLHFARANHLLHILPRLPFWWMFSRACSLRCRRRFCSSATQATAPAISYRFPRPCQLLQSFSRLSL